MPHAAQCLQRFHSAIPGLLITLHYGNFAGRDGAVLSGLKTAAPEDIATHYC